MKRSAVVLGLVAAVLITPILLEATVLSGRVGVSSYLWERSEHDGSDTRHLQNTGTLSLRLARIGGRDLTVSTSLRGRYDARNVGDNADDYRVYNLRIRWRKIADRIDLTGGRHRVYWPTGTVALDGGSASVRLGRGVAVGGYLGSTTPANGRFKMVDYDDGRAFGVQLSRRDKTVGRLVLAFAERRLRRDYTVGGETVSAGDLSSRRLGLNWRRTIRNFGSVYGQLNYDMPRRRVGRAHLSLRWRATPKVTVNGQIRYRRPDIAYNSIFWVFGPARYYEGRLRLNIRVNQHWSVNVGGTYIDLVTDNTRRFDLGLAHRYFSLMLHGKAGGVGRTIGVTGDALYPLNATMLLRGGARFSSFEFQETQAESNSEAALWAGWRWHWMPQASLDLEAQFLSQDLTTQRDFGGNKSDVRLLARLSWWFFNRMGG